MKRILVVAVAAILAWCGFTFFSNHAGAEAHDAEHGHEQEHEEGILIIFRSLRNKLMR